MEKLVKILAWQLTKVRNKKEVIDVARRKGHTVHFASLMNVCHPKNSELEPQYQKYKDRVVFRGDIEKGDSGSFAVFTEQGSSASQMMAAKNQGHKIKTTRMRRTSSRCSIRLCPGQSGRCTVVMENSTKSECPDIWIRLPQHKWPKSMSRPLERNLYGHPLAGLSWERQCEKLLLEHGWEKVFKMRIFCQPSKRTIPVSACARYQTGRQN